MPSDPFNFPVWAFVNRTTEPEHGHPFYLMVVGGEAIENSVPQSVPVFPSRAAADRVGSVAGYGPPFEPMQLGRDAFFEALRKCRYAEDVVFDLGTPRAVVHRVEELLVKYDGG